MNKILQGKTSPLEQRSQRPEVGGERLQSQRKKGEKSAGHTNVRAKSEWSKGFNLCVERQIDENGHTAQL